MTTLKNPIFFRVFCYFPFSVFFFFLFSVSIFQHKKKKKMQFSFLKPHFWWPKILQKQYFDTLWHYLCYKKAKNTIKLGKNSKKNLDQFLTYNLDQFLTYKTPNLGPVFNFTTYIYIYIYSPPVSYSGQATLGHLYVSFFVRETLDSALLLVWLTRFSRSWITNVRPSRSKDKIKPYQHK